MNRLTPRLYVDEDAMNHRVINGLRARGIGVLTAFEADSIGTDDASQLRLASEQQRVLYTFNVADFCRLHAQWMQAGDEHWGIIISARQSYSVGEQIRRLSGLISTVSFAAFRNRIEFL